VSGGRWDISRCEAADGRFLMNLVELKKGEGMYVGADGPHAWLTGGTFSGTGIRSVSC